MYYSNSVVLQKRDTMFSSCVVVYFTRLTSFVGNLFSNMSRFVSRFPHFQLNCFPPCDMKYVHWVISIDLSSFGLPFTSKPLIQHPNRYLLLTSLIKQKHIPFPEHTTKTFSYKGCLFACLFRRGKIKRKENECLLCFPEKVLHCSYPLYWSLTWSVVYQKVANFPNILVFYHKYVRECGELQLAKVSAICQQMSFFLWFLYSAVKRKHQLGRQG